jgi:hypothetical protein
LGGICGTVLVFVLVFKGGILLASGGFLLGTSLVLAMMREGRRAEGRGDDRLQQNRHSKLLGNRFETPWKKALKIGMCENRELRT